MKYVAEYSYSIEMAELAIAMLKDDTYYAGGQYGTGIVDRTNNGGLVVYVNHKAIELDDISVKDVLSLKKVSWRSCVGNFTELEFKGPVVKLAIDSRRHGIPYRQELKEVFGHLVPENRAVYSTQEPEWEFWETIDDNN